MRRERDPEDLIEVWTLLEEEHEQLRNKSGVNPQKRLRDALTGFDQALELGTTDGVEITRRHGEPWIKVSPPAKQEEPENLVALKAAIQRRRGTIDLIDTFMEAEFATGFTSEVASLASQEAVLRDVLRCRLLLELFALGTDMGIKRVVATGKTASPRRSCAGSSTCREAGWGDAGMVWT
ncbi:hypothetical protein [Streptomyces chiangmaiensis]|uniref:Uncharacterized protein n=1 Tax=Streptomyces chiangmaiensis TaxID=766497 RepID=A0ABU7FR29_9ACTN|nr:hypothetical protein [Streptomyces chiangmaiensis]MED7826207.1 hypothetical protein [Streptomyces chiangmaiensis]